MPSGTSGHPISGVVSDRATLLTQAPFDRYSTQTVQNGDVAASCPGVLFLRHPRLLLDLLDVSDVCARHGEVRERRAQAIRTRAADPSSATTSSTTGTTPLRPTDPP